MSPYGVGGGHRHTPEIEQNLTAAAGPGRRCAGLVHAHPGADAARASSRPARPGSLDAASGTGRRGIREAWAKAYADEPFVHLLPEGQWPSTASVLGSNCVHVQVTLDERVGRVVAVAAVDNLTKGTAGAAVQCMNLALGLPETTGLPMAGVAP